ncbi:LysR substrate-binding domain-containing protein [Ralstonia nicotianae]|uniref:LysR substrate-binding domain-containing protein n=1 Tax=Ralstonia pseudosolanacearum TaxID=1310165 RepID=UPI000CE362BC|nr:LysR family transcriptional regulator [Ralstonia pseudosolanacearum]MCF1442291.1 LysR family transcriptional regulator [Ralstonia solanacearum]MDO3523046.1 LysR family transcriptional regulator [Ralstonia pseudosolanacearum]MDO3546646.1 LysR family transcriptional regulator [Ralstonia pseudosolanacearum]MDO3552110.1 LysR family transcriptional regulator [Ralstonia pseudosolanacearum]MDO3565924.1 LysR family transcriptional regulator [Ralstonia pseudosolanacearum]
MDRLQAMQVFTRVVEASSFTKAADNLQLPRATVTNLVQSLEAHLGVRLLHRTTRRVNVTADGAAYYERCVRILGDLEETEAAFSQSASGARGTLRIDVPGSIGKRLLVPRIRDFHDAYPGLQLEIGMSDRTVDLVQEGVDCAVRVGELQDSTLVARRIGQLSMVNCASPDYLERYGTPRSLEDLQDHIAVNYFSPRNGRRMDWDFVIDGQKQIHKVRSLVSVNDAESAMACALHGLGLLQTARLLAYEHLQSGQLVEVLPDHISEPLPVSVIYPHNRHLSPKVRVFVDWVAMLFADHPCLRLKEPLPRRRVADAA